MSVKGVGLLLCAASVLAGCGGGGDGPGASCRQVQPCGGEVAGNWKLAAYCQRAAADAVFASAFAAEVMGSNCPTQTVRIRAVQASGSFLLSGDASYAVSFEYRADLDINVPASCLSASDCATVSANLQAEIAAGARPGVVSGSCSGSPECLCREVLVVPQSEVGNYTTAGTVLTFTAPFPPSITASKEIRRILWTCPSDRRNSPSSIPISSA